jgi:hypothetical protein
MRRVKTALGLATAVCALGAMAVSASAANTHVFKDNAAGKIISEAEPVKTKGVAEGPQEFRFGPFEITCEAAVAKGKLINEESKTFYTEVRYSKCTTWLKARNERVGPFIVHFKTPVDFEFHANGFAETGAESESEVKILNPGAVSAKIGGTGCVITWPAQTVPIKAIKHPEDEFSAAVYSNTEVANGKIKQFPSGFQKKLLITSEFKKLESSVEEGKCSGFTHPETKTGYYKGTLLEEAKSGNLYYE